MSTIESKIREYGQKRKHQVLKQYVEELHDNDLIEMVENQINNSNFVHTLNYLMQSFTDSYESHKKRFKVTLAILKHLENNKLTGSQNNAVVTRLCMELPKFKSEQLVELCLFCTECIQKGNVTEMSWKDLMPEVLNVLVEREHVEYNDTEMTGYEYKTQVINSLCMLQWSANIIIPLTSMFTDMPLVKDEHFQVVNKLGQYIEKLTCQEIPAFVYQLLRLCKHHNSRSLFIRLQNYFGSRIYCSMNFKTDMDSESTNMDIIDDGATQDAISAESTVLFHIYQAASLSHEGIKDYLASLKHLQKSPEFILHPFQLTVLLTISTIPIYEEKVFDIIKFCIARSINEELKKVDSCWFREMISNTSKIESIFYQIIDFSVEERDLVVQGLVNLGHVLLGVGAMLGKDVVAEKQWQLGSAILIKIMKKKRNVASCIIQSFNNRVLTGQNVTQYIECLNVMSRRLPLLMLENQSCMVELMEYLVQVPGSTANQLLDALIPLTKISPTIRDHLIILLRKALYARSTETRQMAVTGFLKLMKNLKIANLAALSQSSTSSGSFSSSHSLLTQISINHSGLGSSSTFSNEALCLEVLGILRRCFMQQVEVRMQLYDGLYDAVCMNPELGIPILDILWIHFNNFFVSDENVLPPLQFAKITATKDVEVILQEPLGKLVYAIGLILVKMLEREDENPSVTRFEKALESLCARMTNCELIHFELDDGTDLLDVMPESQQKLIVLKQALSLYEALIGYKICSWGPTSQNSGQIINNLFQGYNRLLDFFKNINRPKKADGKKKKSDDGKASQSQKSSSKKDGNQKHAKTFRLPNTVLDFQAIGKVLSLLHKSQVDWASSAQANILKTKKDFHRHMIQASIHLVQTVKNNKTVHIHHTKMYYSYLTEIAALLYERCVERLEEFIDFDCTTAILALECFHLILSVVCMHYKSNLPSFLSVVGNKCKGEELTDLLKIFINTYQKLFEIDEEVISQDPEVKKLYTVVINSITLLVSQIPTENNTLSVQVLTWLKNYVDDKKIQNKQVAATFINLLFTAHTKFKSSVSLFEKVAVRVAHLFGTINEDNEDVEELSLIDESTAITVLQSICSSLKLMLDDVDWIVLRLRAEYTMITYPGEDSPERRKEYLKSKERGVCCQMCSIINIFHTLSNVTVPPGNLSEAILKNLTHLYNTLNCLTKYFILRSSKINLAFQGARFEQVVKLSGKQLSNVVYEFIMYIEESQKQSTQSTQNKKKTVDSSTLKTKVLRETRLIPKVVYEIEQFGKSVILLSNKTKVDLTKFVGQGTARDFRIKGLKEILEKVANNSNLSQDHDTSVERTVNNDSEEENVNGSECGSDKENESGSEQEAPPKKKSRK